MSRSSSSERKKVPSRDLHCIIHFLNESTQLYRCNGKELGGVLMDRVFSNVNEPQYFGLIHLGPDCARQWLDADKTLRHQLKCSKGEVHLYFEVKYYVDHPNELTDKQTRHLFFLQTWNKVVDGSLMTTPQTTCLLTSYYLQLTHGPLVSESEDVENMSKLDRLPEVVRDNTSLMIELRTILKEQTEEQALANFLQHIRRVELYGVEVHQAKDGTGKSIELAISGRNVTVYRRLTQKLTTFSWCSITRLSYKRKRFFIQLQKDKFEEHGTVICFTLSNRRAAKRLWLSCVEQHSFFRLGQTLRPDSKHLSKGVCWPLVRKLTSTGNSCLCTSPAAMQQQQSTTPTYRRRQIGTVQHDTLLLPPRPAWSDALSRSSCTDDLKSSQPPTTATCFKDAASCSSPPIYSSRSVSSAAAFTPSTFLIHSLHLDDEIHNNIGFADQDSLNENENGCTNSLPPPLYLSDTMEAESDCGKGLFHVRLCPDGSGLFGLNLRYEKERSCAHLSRLQPNSSATETYPPLRVGDELMAVNGEPVACLSQEQLVDIFRSARQSSLTLSLRRSGYLWSENEDETVEWTPSACEGDNVNQSMNQSAASISDGLRTGRLLSHFDLLPRSRPELSTSVARHEDNINKNRYGDIFPYDCNRVVLPSCDVPGGQDYINASYINMPLADGTVARYIATQGPLANTVEDFLNLIWQEEVTLIAMVTPQEERGKEKCHRYWPEQDEIFRAGELVMSSQLVSDYGHYLHRQLLLVHQQTGEARTLQHLQYVDWPDHGAPESANQFLDYVRYAQNFYQEDAQGLSIPVLVHCSAGIGRTGAFILLDTALRLSDVACPVNPISLVKTMRDQRPLMLQTSIQFQYVCECIIADLTTPTD